MSAMRPVLVTLFLFGLAAASFAQKGGDEVAPSAYRIRQGDKLSIKFFTNPDLNEPSLTVRPDGYISLQIIDDVKAEGLTAGELKAKLEKAYDETLLTPIITVSVIDFVRPHVFISGFVAKPGRYELRDAQTLMELVAVAGGFTRDANRKMVVHARPNGSGDWDIRRANAADVLKPGSAHSDIPLRDGDHVYVPESKLSQFSRAVESFRGLLPRFF
jgi:polysaccharide biosynthesis/export protein